MTPMKERASIGTRWRRRRDKTLWRIVQTHRTDRIAELVPEGYTLTTPRRKVFVTFTDLRTRFEEVDA
jgi:hypothetical protein